MSAATEVLIYNRALAKVGAKRITATDQDHPNALACNNCYETLRDALLRSHAWNFAIKRVSLAADAVTPAWGRANSFALPSDYLRWIPPYPESNYAQRDWIVENGCILTNDTAPLSLRYVAKITDPVAMDPLFREALSCWMAVEICETITQSNTKKDRLETNLKLVLAEARKANAFERVAALPPQDEWLDARA